MERFTLYPAIDILDGEVVRLSEGKFEDCTVYSENALDTALAFQKAGAEYLHLVDLSGARSPDQSQAQLVEMIVKSTNLKIQVGGGIRTADQIERYLKAGAKRVVLGSLAVQNPTLVKLFFEQYGPEAITLAFDLRYIDKQYFVSISGWQEQSQLTLAQALEPYRGILKHALCTDVSRDGKLQGPNLALYLTITTQFPEVNWMASGGVREITDLKHLKSSGVAGAIVGKAIYERQFTVHEALSVC